MKKIIIFLSVFAIGVCQGESSEAKKLHVAFINAHPNTDTFWTPVIKFMEAAGNDLNMKITIHSAELNHLKMVRLADNVINGPDKPDFIIFKCFKRQGPDILKIAEDAGVKAFVFNAPMTEKNRKKYGGPRETFKNWIGQMLPNDEQAGYDLANILIEQGKKQGLTDADGKVHITGLGGILADTPSILRINGLKRAIKNRTDVVLHQVTPTDWSKEDAISRYSGLLERYPQTKIGWAANDPISLGIVESIKQAGKRPGKDFLTGGIDWINEALVALKNGEMAVSIGGHFMEGGWVMVLLYDYAHGIDFASESVSMNSTMSTLTNENIGKYVENFGTGDWDKIDFKEFSKKHNPSLKKYNFTLDAILK